MEDIERDATVVKELYDLIETYKVPTPPEDFAVYQVKSLTLKSFLILLSSMLLLLNKCRGN